MSTLYRALDTGSELTLTLRESETSLVTVIFSHDRQADLNDFPDSRTADVADLLDASFTRTDTGLALTLPRENNDLRHKFAGG